jgi:RNA polymerase sigma factor (sigma-70 family)
VINYLTIGEDVLPKWIDLLCRKICWRHARRSGWEWEEIYSWCLLRLPAKLQRAKIRPDQASQFISTSIDRLCLDYARSARKQREREVNFGSLNVKAYDRGDQGGTEQECIERVFIEQFLQTLSPQDTYLVRLLGQGYSYEEISRDLNIGAHAVKRRVYDARKRWRQYLNGS